MNVGNHIYQGRIVPTPWREERQGTFQYGIVFIISSSLLTCPEMSYISCFIKIQKTRGEGNEMKFKETEEIITSGGEEDCWLE